MRKKTQRSSTVGVELRPEYKRADFPQGLVRGRYAGRVVDSRNVVRLDPEIAAAFPTSAAVNRALAKVLRDAKTERGRALMAKAAGRRRTS
jgi:hypothetical protein